MARLAKECCCTAKTCGYCSSTTLEDDQAGQGTYCLDVPSRSHNPDDEEHYGASCPDVEYMEICVEGYMLDASITCSPFQSETVCNGDESYDCWAGYPLNQEGFTYGFPVYRSATKPCRWESQGFADDNWLDISGSGELGGTHKPCFHTNACTCDPVGRYYRNTESSVITMGYQIKVEIEVTPYCIQDSVDEYNMRYPIGTCGRIVQTVIHFRFNGEPVDDPNCVASGTCNDYADLLSGAGRYIGPSELNFPLEGGSVRFMAGRSSKFFPSCGCLPYCWQDEDCEECGDYSCFYEEETPEISIDANTRDRWCNAKHCGPSGCCNQVAPYNVFGLPSCSSCVEEKDAPFGKPPWQIVNGVDACDNIDGGRQNVLGGRGDECGRGKVWGCSPLCTTDNLLTYLIWRSNTQDPTSSEAPCGNDPDTGLPRYNGCCGSLDNGCKPCARGCQDPSWGYGGFAGIKVPLSNMVHGELSPPDDWYTKGFAVNWRWVAT